MSILESIIAQGITNDELLNIGSDTFDISLLEEYLCLYEEVYCVRRGRFLGVIGEDDTIYCKEDLVIYARYLFEHKKNYGLSKRQIIDA